MSSPYDIEAKNEVAVDVSSVSNESVYEDENIFLRFIHSFLPPKSYSFDTTDMSKQEIALTYMTQTGHRMSSLEIVIISWAGCIGTGLLIGTGGSLKSGGPAGLLVGQLFPAAGVICVMFCVGELASRYKTISPYYEFPKRFMDESWAFTLGWCYAMIWVMTVPLELIAGSMLTSYWHDEAHPVSYTNPGAWIAVMIAFTCIIQLSGSRAYGAYEAAAGALKLVGITGFIIYAIVIICGGGPHSGYIGGKNWHNPEPAPEEFGHGFANSVKGCLTAMMSWTFSYGGTEITAIYAADSSNPARAIPSVGKRAIWRILLWFVLSSTLAATVIPCGTQGLGATNSGSGSMYVLAFQNEGIQSLASVFNAYVNKKTNFSLIIISVVTMANNSIYVGARTLVALAVHRQAPSIFLYVDRAGRPLAALAPSLLSACIGFVSASGPSNANQAFTWLYAWLSYGFLFIWLSICVCFVNFRLAAKVQGFDKNELLYKSPFGFGGGVFGVLIFAAILSIQFWIYIWPIGYGSMSPTDRATSFFENDLSIVTILFVYVVHKIWFKTGFIWPKDIDLKEGSRDVEWEELKKEQDLENEALQRNRIRYYTGKLFS